MSYKTPMFGYGVYMKEAEDVISSVADDFEDGYTCSLCNTSYEKDLQLAAELGKTLLERNKELETTVRQNQTVIDDQAQEIEYLTKQTAALREVNDSRLRIYEQLEVSILELERNNQRLTLDAAADKKHIKTLCVSIDQLEARYEELQRKYQDAVAEIDKQRRQADEPNTTEPLTHQQINCEELDRLRGELQEARNQNLRDQRRITKLEEQVAALVQENAVLEEQLGEYGRKEDELRSLQEEISILEDVRNGQACLRCARGLSSGGIHQYGSSTDYAYSDAGTDGGLADPEEDVATNGDAPIEQESNVSNNPYRDLVQKYEALVQIQPHNVVRCQPRQNACGPPQVKETSPPAIPAAGNEPRSLQEELAMSGDFSSFRNEDSDSGDEIPAGRVMKASEKASPAQAGKPTVAAARTRPATSTPTPTPTDFSEAETSSSGFSDETSNKATQTEPQHQIAAACASAALAGVGAGAGKGLPQGSFLCTITDGDDCRFSIYDEASSVESRFRKAPEYRTLFREIFQVLKRAAEAKDEGEKLPLLEDERRNAPRNPPSTPAREDLPLLTLADGTGASVISEEPSEVCSSNGDVLAAAAECLAAVAAAAAPIAPKALTDVGKSVTETPAAETPVERAAPATPTPKRDIMEYLAMGLGPKKKSHSRKNSPHPSPRRGEDACPSPPAVVGARRVTYARAGGRRKRDRAASPASPASPASRNQPSASSVHASASLAARCAEEHLASTSSAPSKSSPGPSGTPPVSAVWAGRPPSWDVKRPFASAASKEVAKLKRLEESYADVLRRKPSALHRKN